MRTRSNLLRMTLVALTSCMCCLYGISSATAEDAEGASSPQDLLAKFQDAFSKKNNAKFQNLLYKPGLSKKAEASMMDVFTSDSCSGSAKNTRMISKATYDETLTKNGRKPKNGPIFRNGIAYDYPIPLSGYLAFDLTGKKGENTFVSYPVGKSPDDRLFFIARVKVRQRAAD